MAPITEEKYDGQPLLVSTTRLNDGMSIMFYKIGKESPQYEIEIYSHVRRSRNEDIIWLNNDEQDSSGDIRAYTFLKIDNAPEAPLPCDCYYSEGSIVYHAQITPEQATYINAASRLALKISLPGLVMDIGDSEIVVTDTVLNEWQRLTH